MARSRYWKITSDEVGKFVYDQSKLLNWEIKCIRQPESDAIFVGVFLYRNGTPFDYESIKGVMYFHNNVPKNELPSITKFLQGRYGGKPMEKGQRVFLKDSKEIYSGEELEALAKALEKNLDAKAVISLEFDDMDQEEQKASGLPEAKLLPIPGK